MRRTHGPRLWLPLVALLLASSSGVPAAAGTATFSVDAETAQSFLRAVTPYQLVVGKAGLSETITFSNPRDLRFEKGRIHLRLDVRGTPFPLELVLNPVITVGWNKTLGVFEARIESLPLAIPGFGDIDIAHYLDPYPIPSVFYQPAGDEQVDFIIEGHIKSIRILESMIHVGADLRFRRVMPAADATSQRTSGRR